MLYPYLVAALSFSAPVSRTTVPSMQMTDFKWRQTFNGKPPGEFAAAAWSTGTGVVVPTGGAAASGEMSVPQACIFMAANPTVTPEAKAAFLLEKGVSPFVIAQSDCTSPADNVQGHP